MSVPVYSWSGVYRGGVSFCLSWWVRTVQETDLKVLAYLNSFVLLKYFPLKPLVMSFAMIQIGKHSKIAKKCHGPHRRVPKSRSPVCLFVMLVSLCLCCVSFFWQPLALICAWNSGCTVIPTSNNSGSLTQGYTISSLDLLVSTSVPGGDEALQEHCLSSFQTHFLMFIIVLIRAGVITLWQAHP